MSREESVCVFFLARVNEALSSLRVKRLSFMETARLRFSMKDLDNVKFIAYMEV